MKLIIDTCTNRANNLLAVSGLKLVPYIDKLRRVAAAGDYQAPESSLNLPADEELLSAVEQAVAAVVTSALKTIIVIGIGGSNLGTKAIYDALYAVPHTGRSLFFVDTNNAATLESCRQLIAAGASSEEFLLVSISKSGGTSETLANTEIIMEQLFVRFGSVVKERLIVITDECSAYAVAAAEQGVRVLTMPVSVGGRFSVFSAVGLFPLLALGLPIQELRAGAEAMRQECLNPDIALNPAAQSALIMHQAFQSGMVVADMFVFKSELESVGKWYRQLLGESIGKVTNVGVRVGLTPTVSVGSTDLHSVAQLYLGGPVRTVTSFVYSQTDDSSFVVPVERLFPNLAPMITGRTATEIMTAIRLGTVAAYNDAQLPFMEIQLGGLTPAELGALMQFKMIEMMYLGYLFDVNPFDQPAVELYKVVTKQLLEG